VQHLIDPHRGIAEEGHRGVARVLLEFDYEWFLVHYDAKRDVMISVSFQTDDDGPLPKGAIQSVSVKRRESAR
jgi:hypothetical protein